LPPVLETFEVDDAAYLVLDMPPGRPLADGWQDPSVSDRQRLNWLLQLCSALEALQSAGAGLLWLLYGSAAGICVVRLRALRCPVPSGRSSLAQLPF
jgi:hypothetical protein